MKYFRNILIVLFIIVTVITLSDYYMTKGKYCNQQMYYIDPYHVEIESNKHVLLGDLEIINKTEIIRCP